MDRPVTTPFWDWAILELLVLSGLRIEEACELTTLDVLRRQLPDGRRYYLLHVKPSKYDRARVIPIGDGLGRVIAEIVRHVRAFHGLDAVPPFRAWDSHEKRWRPSAPYLLQTAAGHPSVIDEQTIRARLARVSAAAGASRGDGRPLLLRPHDCRRMFASEHLNSATPPHVIQALLGHATIDTVLIYAKLYPTTLVEEYRKSLHGTYHRYGGADAVKNPTADEWQALDQACSMRDMGTHLCALPVGQHCPRAWCVSAVATRNPSEVLFRPSVSCSRATSAPLTVGAKPESPQVRLQHANWRWIGSITRWRGRRVSVTMSLRLWRRVLRDPRWFRSGALLDRLAQGKERRCIPAGSSSGSRPGAYC